MHAIAAQERAGMLSRGMTDSRIGIAAAPGQNGRTVDDQIARSDQPTTDGGPHRQEEERLILKSIAARFEEEPALREAFCIVIDGEGWHRGVIGITATRVVERYGRPALVISRDGEQAHGSGRSIHAFHLLDALESCAGLFTRFGGHAHAVGFSLPAARVSELRAHLDDYARSRLTPADFESLHHLEDNLLRFQDYYADTARPFEWKFTRTDLEKLLSRIALAEAA